jgi:hypothetical protein
MADFTPPLDVSDYVVAPEREPEPVADVLRKSIARPAALSLSAILVRTAISLEMPTAFPVIGLQYSSLYEIAERFR